MNSSAASSAAEPWLIDAVRARAAEFATQLRTRPAEVTGATPLPGFDWTVADIAQHVACLPKFWGSISEQGDSFETPSDFAAFSDQARAHITETDPVALADLIEAEFATLADELSDPSAPTRVLYRQPVSTHQLGGLAVSELVVHGRDLATVTKATAPSFTRAEANAAVDGLMAVTPAFVDPDKARKQPDGVYHLSFRGGRDYTWTKSGPTLAVDEGRPPKADAHLLADPAMFILSAQGRIGQVRAGLSGKMMSYGRRPWRFLGLGTLTVDGV